MEIDHAVAVGIFSLALQQYMKGIGAKFFGDDSERVNEFNGEMLDTDNWGGSTLSDHHTFIVRYRPEEDPSLDMHVDECDVTFSFGIMDDNFEGSDLCFCGMFGFVPLHNVPAT